MKTVKFIIVMFVIFTTVICAFADTLVSNVDTNITMDTIEIVKDTVIVGNSSTSNAETSNSMIVLVLGVLLSLYELFARFIPTVKDISILSWVMKFISTIVPNLKKEGGQHKI